MLAKGKFSKSYLEQARAVLAFDSRLAEQVSKGTISLKRAYRIVLELKPRPAVPQPEPVPIVGTKSQRLMALAKTYPAGLRHADRDGGIKRIVKAAGVSYVHLQYARRVLRESPELAASVLRGEISLHMAWKTIRDSPAFLLTRC
jgi:hypothetical protein